MQAHTQARAAVGSGATPLPTDDCTHPPSAQAALASYLRAALPTFPRGAERVEVLQVGHGQSNPTYLLQVCERESVGVGVGCFGF